VASTAEGERSPGGDDARARARCKCFANPKNCPETLPCSRGLLCCGGYRAGSATFVSGWYTVSRNCGCRAGNATFVLKSGCGCRAGNATFVLKSGCGCRGGDGSFVRGRYLGEVGTMGAVVGDVGLRGFGILVLSSSLESFLEDSGV
jgi:hypothetical protein